MALKRKRNNIKSTKTAPGDFRCLGLPIVHGGRQCVKVESGRWGDREGYSH